MEKFFILYFLTKSLAIFSFFYTSFFIYDTKFAAKLYFYSMLGIFLKTAENVKPPVNVISRNIHVSVHKAKKIISKEPEKEQESISYNSEQSKATDIHPAIHSTICKNEFCEKIICPEITDFCDSNKKFLRIGNISHGQGSYPGTKYTKQVSDNLDLEKKPRPQHYYELENKETKTPSQHYSSIDSVKTKTLNQSEMAKKILDDDSE